MKKILVALVVAAFAPTALATIAGGPHDMSTAAHGGNLSACTYCHAPHLFIPSNIANATTQAPLWNRNMANTVVTPYTSQTFSQALTSNSVGSNTRLCLSCHDGATGISIVNNGSSTTILNVAGRTNANLAAGNMNIGVNLTNDHPVGVNYATTQLADPGQYANPTWTNGIQLFGGTVECGSCHEPHSSVSKFLRVPSSQLCANCHLK